MKRKFYFYSLLMAIVMMAVSPTRVWAQYDGGDEGGGYEEGGYDDPSMSCDHSYAGECIGATCTEPGYTTYTCTNCGDSYTVYDDPIGHNFIDGVCINCGALESGEDGEAGSSDFIYISGSGGFNGEGAEKLIDGNDRTKWCSNWSEDSKPYVIFKAAEPISITGYSMVHGNDTGKKDGQGREWAEWTIYGANFASDAEATEDSEEWQEVDSRSGFSYGDDYSFGDLSCGLYQYYKIVVESNYSGELQQMAEIHFTYDACEHQWGEDCKCTICGYKCKHQELGEDGKCTVCGLYVPTFASLDELLANDPDYDVINITINNKILFAGQSEGEYIVKFNGYDVSLIGPVPDHALDWQPGGTLTGTLTNVKWDLHDKNLYSEDASLWLSLEYTEPDFGDVTSYNSIQELIDANPESGTPVNVIINGTIDETEYYSNIYQVTLDNGFAIASIGVTSDPGWAVGGTVSGTLENVTFMRNDDEGMVGVMSMTKNIFAPGAGLDYSAPAGGSESSDVASVTINGVETTYSDINEALNTAIYGAKTTTLKLLADVEFPYSVPCNDGHDITIDLNNHTYTATLDENDYEAFCHYGDSKLTIKNGTLISSRNAFNVSGNSSLNIFNCTIEAEKTDVRVGGEESVVNIENTNMSSETDNAIYMDNGTVNLSGNCRFTPGADWAPIFVDNNGNGAINFDLGYMMVDHEGTKIASFELNIGTHGQYVEVVADPDAVAECAAGSHNMEHHDAVPATCTTTGKVEYWHCTVCGRDYADAEGNTRLPSGIIPDTPIAHNYVDGVCANCGLPIIVTAENYESLGLKAEHVGYYAIQNLANLAFFAEGFGSHITPATEPEVGEDNGNGPIEIEARLRTNEANGNDQQKTRRNAIRKAAAEQGDFLGFVLTNDIVVNANLLDANGKAKDRDNNGNIRADLLAWEPVELHCYGNSQLIIDGNGHTISGLYQNSPSGNFETLGFISCADYGITIKNLGITDSYFGSIMEGYSYSMGSLVSWSMANIENCWSDATIDVQNAEHAGIGGLVGIADGGNIYDSYFSGRIMTSGASEVAGLVPNIYCDDDVTISNCHFSGSMSCEQGNIEFCTVSGLVGNTNTSNSNIFIERCYADGKIDAEGSSAEVSGLFSYLYANDGGTASVRNNYNAMTVNAPNYYGLFNYAEGNGIIAFNVNADKNADFPYGGAYINGYSNISVADEENDYDDGFVIEVTEEQMASGAVAYELNMLNEMFVPGEEVGPGEGGPVVVPGEGEPVEVVPVVPRARLRAAAEETAPIWYQLIGVDAHPVLSGDEYSIVYCDDDEPTPASVFYNLARTFDSYDLADGTEYTIKSKTNVTELTYQRTFGGTNWTTWYVPFDLVLTDEICQKLAFSRINNVHQYDDDDNGTPDRTIIESFRQKAGVTLKANYPYLVKALDESALSFELTLNDVVLAPAKENSIDCQSVDYTYTFTGTYTGMDDSGPKRYSLFDDEESNSWLHFHSLEPQRHYMTITSRNGGNDAAPAKVRLMVVGDEDVTGIVTIYSDEQQRDGTYDLMGRKIDSNSKQPGLRIVNGKKVLFK